jgi:dTDP-4-amino-4,6-dideoxygalactose transaminase
MVTTNDKRLFESMLSYRSLCCRTYDPKVKYLAIDEARRPMGKQYWYVDFDDVGFNYRMTDAQAAVGSVQLRKLDSFNARRVEIAAKYTKGLRGIKGLTLPHISPFNEHVFHIYGVLLDGSFPRTKEDLMWDLYTKKGIKAWSHYMPIHLSAAFKNLGHRPGECPVAEKLLDRYVSIPIHPRMSDDTVQYVIDSIRELS